MRVCTAIPLLLSESLRTQAHLCQRETPRPAPPPRKTPRRYITQLEQTIHDSPPPLHYKVYEYSNTVERVLHPDSTFGPTTSRDLATAIAAAAATTTAAAKMNRMLDQPGDKKSTPSAHCGLNPWDEGQRSLPSSSPSRRDALGLNMCTLLPVLATFEGYNSRPSTRLHCWLSIPLKSPAALTIHEPPPRAFDFKWKTLQLPCI